MFQTCFALWRVLFVLFEVSLFLQQHFAYGLLMSKSDLTLCSSVEKNPHNVVDDKPCQKKLIIAHAVRSGQTGTETFLFTTNKVYDGVEKKKARLYYPFTVSISKSRLRYVYPFFYETTVNNKPFEEIRTKISCADGFNDARATCGFAHDHKGNKIWDSQGFCCSCSLYDKVPKWSRWLVFGGKVGEFYRGGQGGLCGYKYKHGENDKFSHCMRMDDLWYDVFSIRPPRISLVISIQAFEQVKTIVNNKTHTEWVDGGKIELNYQKRSGIGQHGRLLASFHGTFESTNEVPNLVHKYLLIPKVTSENSAYGGHEQIRVGASHLNNGQFALFRKKYISE